MLTVWIKVNALYSISSPKVWFHKTKQAHQSHLDLHYHSDVSKHQCASLLPRHLQMLVDILL